MLQWVEKVTLEDLTRKLKELYRLFDPKQSTMVTVCASGTASDVAEGYSKLGFKMETLSVEEFIKKLR
jgi:hypothetical protein